MSATGTEAVTLSQLKMLKQQLGGAGGKKYKIEAPAWQGPHQVQSSASAGDVVITAAGDGVANSVVLELVEEDPHSGKFISELSSSSSYASIDDLPQVVQDALANIPQTMAPTPTRKGYQWFIMPPCDVYIEVY